ncbi:MAG: hybrid sensor histidine kinase/response regulator [Smithellaceae bacterium]|nr:hybrid sensor histidine kinase/response regulator [Smithellaceae bacterium]
MRLLITDDEPGMRSGVERALRNLIVTVPDVEGEISFSIIQSATGGDTMRIITEETPDILLLDYKLPDMTGLEILEAITREKLDILTVMITAYASLDTAVTATKQGAYDFLAKPFTPDEIRAVVRKAARHVVLQRQARKFAEERKQVRFRFISVLAHELKAPLNALEGYLHIIKDRSAGNDQLIYDQMINRCLARTGGMYKLILDLLDLTRIESGQMQREISLIDLREVAAEAIEAVSMTAKDRGITVNFSTDQPLRMRADRGELGIIMNNLVSNAVKYNVDGGWVEVTIKRDGDFITIQVTDSGIGMSEEERAGLFNDFVRIKNEKTRQIMGSGLGLSTVKKLTSLYEGDITVESEPDKGSTFLVRLKEAEQD